MAYSPPLTITPRLITLVSEISELIGHLALTHDGELAPQLLRGNRIRLFFQVTFFCTWRQPIWFYL